MRGGCGQGVSLPSPCPLPRPPAAALDLVEGVAVAVRGSVQLQLAGRLEAVRCRGGGPRRSLRGWCVVVVLRGDWCHRGRRLMVVVVLYRGGCRSRCRVLVLAEVGIVPARIVLAVIVIAATTGVRGLGRLVLRLRLVLGLRRRLGRGRWRYRQMVTGRLESVAEQCNGL